MGYSQYFTQSQSQYLGKWDTPSIFQPLGEMLTATNLTCRAGAHAEETRVQRPPAVAIPAS